MKKGTGKIILAAFLGLWIVNSYYENILLITGLGGVLSVSLLIWGWLQRRDTELQKKTAEARQAALSSYEQRKKEKMERKAARERQRLAERHHKQTMKEAARNQETLLKEWQAREKKKEMDYALQGPRLYQIIEESVSIINNTKNVETAIGRFKTIKEMAGSLLEIAPPSTIISIVINNQRVQNITSINDLCYIDALKNRWVATFFKDKIINELKKADMLTTDRLKTAQYKKALNMALKSVSYLPDNPEIRQLVTELEQRATECQIEKPPLSLILL